jgi:hypothetical protein
LEKESYPCLYIIVRNDLKSMTPGKTEAHAAHAGSQFVHTMHTEDTIYDETRSMFKEWCGGSRGFGTKITLAGGIETISSVEDYFTVTVPAIFFQDICAFSYGRVKDPSYPYSDEITGEARTREEVTAFWWFAMNDDPRYEPLRKTLKLK